MTSKLVRAKPTDQLNSPSLNFSYRTKADIAGHHPVSFCAEEVNDPRY
jgi:hypothetical protein